MTLFRHFSFRLAIFAITVFSSAALAAGPHEEPIRRFGEQTVRAWIADPLVVEAIREQNRRNAGLSEADIIAMDQQWRSETGAAIRPMIDWALNNPLSQFLARAKRDQHGIVTEVFVMDNRGLNVGQSDVTSDYWQGDEAKWKQTFLVGPRAMLIDGVELDESTQTFQSQLSMSIVDEATGEVIGAITVGIDVEAIIWADMQTASR